MVHVQLTPLSNGNYRMDIPEQDNITGIASSPSPLPPMEKKRWSWKKRFIVGSASLLAFIGFVFWMDTPFQHETDHARVAYEARMKARRGDCGKIIERLSACYKEGESAACKQAGESAAWFLREYGETHEFACSTADLPFGAGVVSQR